MSTMFYAIAILLVMATPMVPPVVTTIIGAVQERKKREAARQAAVTRPFNAEAAPALTHAVPAAA